MLAGGRGTGRFPRRNLCLVRVVALSPAGHLWVGCSAQLAGWLIDAVFRRKVVRSKTISPAKRFRPSCSGRMAHSCPAYDTDRTPILEIWQIFRIQSWRLFRFVQGFGIHTDPGIGSLREPARAIAPGKKAEPPPIFFVKKDLHSRKKTQAPEENSSDACLLLQTINSSEPSVQSLGISALDTPHA